MHSIRIVTKPSRWSLSLILEQDSQVRMAGTFFKYHIFEDAVRSEEESERVEARKEPMGSKINTQSADVGHRNAHRQSIFVFS